MSLFLFLGQNINILQKIGSTKHPHLIRYIYKLHLHYGLNCNFLFRNFIKISLLDSTEETFLREENLYLDIILKFIKSNQKKLTTTIFDMIISIKEIIYIDDSNILKYKFTHDENLLSPLDSKYNSIQIITEIINLIILELHNINFINLIYLFKTEIEHKYPNYGMRAIFVIIFTRFLFPSLISKLTKLNKKRKYEIWRKNLFTIINLINMMFFDRDDIEKTIRKSKFLKGKTASQRKIKIIHSDLEQEADKNIPSINDMIIDSGQRNKSSRKSSEIGNLSDDFLEERIDNLQKSSSYSSGSVDETFSGDKMESEYNTVTETLSSKGSYLSSRKHPDDKSKTSENSPELNTVKLSANTHSKSETKLKKESIEEIQKEVQGIFNENSYKQLPVDPEKKSTDFSNKTLLTDNSTKESTDISEKTLLTDPHTVIINSEPIEINYTKHSQCKLSDLNIQIKKQEKYNDFLSNSLPDDKTPPKINRLEQIFNNSESSLTRHSSSIDENYQENPIVSLTIYNSKPKRLSSKSTINKYSEHKNFLSMHHSIIRNKSFKKDSIKQNKSDISEKEEDIQQSLNNISEYFINKLTNIINDFQQRNLLDKIIILQENKNYEFMIKRLVERIYIKILRYSWCYFSNDSKYNFSILQDKIDSGKTLFSIPEFHKKINIAKELRLLNTIDKLFYNNDHNKINPGVSNDKHIFNKNIPEKKTKKYDLDYIYMNKSGKIVDCNSKDIILKTKIKKIKLTRKDGFNISLYDFVILSMGICVYQFNNKIWNNTKGIMIKIINEYISQLDTMKKLNSVHFSIVLNYYLSYSSKSYSKDQGMSKKLIAKFDSLFKDEFLFTYLKKINDPYFDETILLDFMSKHEMEYVEKIMANIVH